MLAEYPWFTDADFESAFKAMSTCSSASASEEPAKASDATVSLVPEPLDDEAIAEALPELKKHRGEWEWEDADLF